MPPARHPCMVAWNQEPPDNDKSIRRFNWVGIGTTQTVSLARGRLLWDNTRLAGEERQHCAPGVAFRNVQGIQGAGIQKASI